MELSDYEKEALQDLVESPGWDLMIGKLLKPYLADSTRRVNNLTRQGATPAGCAYEVGKGDGPVDFLNKVYDAAGQDNFQALKELRDFN